MKHTSLMLYATIAVLAYTHHVASAASCVPGFEFAIFAKKKVDIQGNATTDSWDSSSGTYAATSTCADGSVGTNATAGGSFHIQGMSAKVCGDAMVGFGGDPSSVITGNGVITGSESAMSSPVTLPNVTVPALSNGTPFTASWNNQNNSLASNKKYGDITCKNGSLTLVAGTYVFNTLTLTSNCALKITTGPVIVYFTKGIYLQGGAIANTTGVPSNLQLWGGPSATDAQLQGGANAYFSLYAPAASCQLQGNTDVYGAIACDSAEIQGNAHVHYDRALRNLSGGGFACTTIEISRASPVLASISNQDAVVQGTFEWSGGTAKTIASTSDVSSFAFPYVKGHLRARAASSITTTASTFSSGTVLFDAAATGKIPAASYTGCATFDGSCRQVFTITSAPSSGARSQFHPTMVTLSDATASAVGALIAPSSVVSGIGASHWQTIVRKVLDAKLGGVDRSTAAVIEASSFAGPAARPKMIYFGAADGMLHAVCAQTIGACGALGEELWAFLPRVQLPLIRTNTQRIDGSPHVLDVFGDLGSPATGNRSWHTILVFQTGFQGTSTSAAYALDITDPTSPSVVWEYTTPSTPDALDFGTGLTVATGQVTILAAPRTLAFLETSNGGTGGAGVVTTAVDVITGDAAWTFGHLYPTPPRSVAGDLPLPSSGIPGGAAAVDLVGSGFVTDVVFGDLYGSLWRLDASDGASRTGDDTPLFRFTTNKHPIGVTPTIFASAGQEYAVFASGGYVDPVAASWSTSQQYAIGVKLTAEATPVIETDPACVGCDLAFATSLTPGDKGFAQAIVVGTQLFLTTDSTDVNSTTFGTTGADTGRLRALDLATGAVGTAVVITAGAAGLAHAGTTMYASSAQKQQQLATAATTTVGAATEITGGVQFLRQLWLRTE